MKVPKWNVPGVVSEVKQLISPKDQKVWMWVLVVHALGGTYELRCKNPDLIKGIGEGTSVDAVGKFSMYNGRVQFELETCKVA